VSAPRAWYAHNPHDFINGVQGLGPDLIGAYIVVLDLIYARGGPIPNDARWIGGVLGCSSRAAVSLIGRLVKAGKLRIDGELIINDRAALEIENAAKMSRNFRELGAKGGRTKAENAAALNENKDVGLASLYQETGQDITEEKKEAVVRTTDGEPSQDANPTDDPIDLKALLFSTGKPYLIRNGVSAANAGSILGKWRQTYGDGAVIDALALAQAEACSAPIPFITKILEKRNGHTARPMAHGTGAQPVYRSNPALDRYRELIGDLDREAEADARTLRLHN
jgi:uncharacterized protein YdaU (DUF1376 family)